MSKQQSTHDTAPEPDRLIESPWTQLNTRSWIAGHTQSEDPPN